MLLHGIETQLSLALAEACAKSEVISQTVQSVHELYGRRGFMPPWICYLAEHEGEIVGTCGFTGPPIDAEAEIAYFTFPGHEGKGVATAMARELIRLARPHQGQQVLIAHTLPQHGASTTILAKLGFECIGSVEHPEDGVVWKWRETRLASS